MTGTPTPIRSASGSLASTRSAPVALASAIAASSVLGFSGLATWPGTLGKSPSGVRCDARMLTLLNPAVVERRGHRGLADAVERGVDDGQVAGVADRFAHHRRDVGVVDLAPRPERSSRRSIPCENGFSGISRSEAALTQSMIPSSSGGTTWPPRGAIALEAVVRGRIVRRGDHDAGIAAQVPDGEREQGGGPGLGEEVDLEPRRGQDPGAQLGEFRRVVAAVAGDHARLGRVLPLAARHVIGQAAGAFGDRPLVEDVRADGIHHPPPAPRAEFQDGEEGVVERLPPAGGDVLEQPGPVLQKRASVNQRRMAAAAVSESSPGCSAWLTLAIASSVLVMVGKLRANTGYGWSGCPFFWTLRLCSRLTRFTPASKPAHRQARLRSKLIR